MNKEIEDFIINCAAAKIANNRCDRMGRILDTFKIPVFVLVIAGLLIDSWPLLVFEFYVIAIYGVLVFMFNRYVNDFAETVKRI